MGWWMGVTQAAFNVFGAGFGLCLDHKIPGQQPAGRTAGYSDNIANSVQQIGIWD